MAEAKDPAIKLFGKTIPLPDDVIAEELPSSFNNNEDKDYNNISPPEVDMSGDVAPHERDISDKCEQDGNTHHIEESEVSLQGSDKNACQDTSPGTEDNPEALSDANEKLASEPSKSEEEKTETSGSQEKTLKKPDKILPCPRCNSMDTKFCYYNNYNVNQPRHFCKNCQRYWTAGGTMRNVPVGAGRRKNKSSASHYRQITVSEALQNNCPDIPNGTHPGLQNNGTVLTFGSDSPLCESMASILSLAEKTMRNCSDPNGFQKPEDLKVQIPFIAVETGGQLNGSNLEDAVKSSSKEPASPNCFPYPPQVPCYPGAPWPYPWNSAQWSPPVAAPPFCPSGLALPFYPAPAYWGCTVPGTWSIPLIPQPFPAGQTGPSSSPNSPTLGKHSRDWSMLTPNSSEEKQSLWIPKTLRIDDPKEAAKSSIWTTLGIKSGEKLESIGRGSGLFKAFQSKCTEKTPNLETSTVMEANPAALSRSQNFQENS
ncbi:hypothetical protein RND81_10G067800 [Saponaria officinalis]|uniref:Dof-type domain-containing protein n=1 Tax=Saponaria officinalis TaxID=3572 RepID=A0AAW1HZ79_SAPOF